MGFSYNLQTKAWHSSPRFFYIHSHRTGAKKHRCNEENHFIFISRILFLVVGATVYSQAQTYNQIQLDGVELSLANYDDSQLLAYNSNNFVEILVEANSVVDDFCNYFGGSWVSTGLDIYCTLGGDVYTCSIYKSVMMACSINGAVKLALEGDINNSLKSLLKTSAKIYMMSKVGGKFTLKPSR